MSIQSNAQNKKITRLLIANRGEIAIRIMQSAQKLVFIVSRYTATQTKMPCTLSKQTKLGI